MPLYHVNKNAQTNGDHEVHEQGCSHAPLPQNQVQLGFFYTCAGAVAEAKKTYRQSNGCYYCSKECNTG